MLLLLLLDVASTYGIGKCTICRSFASGNGPNGLTLLCEPEITRKVAVF